MPDRWTVNAAGVVSGFERDRKDAWVQVFSIGESFSQWYYQGDSHDVQSPPRINAPRKAAEARAKAYKRWFGECVTCGLRESDHGYYRYWDDVEKNDEDACDEFTRRRPLVAIA